MANISTILYVCLFIPFVILFAIFGTTFMMAGHKKDLGRSLISFGATISAIIASLGISKLIAWVISIPISNFIKKQIPNDNAMASAIIGGSMHGVIKIVLSFLFFAILFPIAMGVLKSVLVKRINVDKLNYDTDKSRLGGLGIRFVDALIVVLMLSLPLYGTIATVVPPIASFAEISLAEENKNQSNITLTSTTKQNSMGITNMDTTSMVDDEEFEDYFEENEFENQGASDLTASYTKILNTVADHPVLIPYKYGPADWVYSGLSSFSMNGKSVDVARAAEVMSGLTDRVITFINVIDNGNEEQVLKAVEDVVSYARDNVIEERWFYNMFMALIGEFDKAVAENKIELGAGEQFINQLRPLFDMTYKEFKSNGVALLDFLEYALGENQLAMFKNNSLNRAEAMQKAEEFLWELGALINHSEQAAAAKQLIYMTVISDEFETGNPEVAFANWGNGILTDENAKKADAAMFFAMTAGTNDYKLLQLMVVNPLFGGEASSQLLTSENLYNLLSGEFEWSVDGYNSDDVRALVNDETFLADIKAKLISYEQLTLFETSYYGNKNDFEDYVLSVAADRLGFDIDFYDDYYSSAYYLETDENGQLYIVDEDGDKQIIDDSIVSSGSSMIIKGGIF